MAAGSGWLNVEPARGNHIVPSPCLQRRSKKMRDKELRKIIFGSKSSFTGNFNRVKNINFINSDDKILFSFRADDGIILTLVERIKTLEEKLEKKSPKK